ncbi:MAG: hypothetical protein GX442_04445 [Candidatus Riflebacteria bacterium]|nr:hypothetical protein [Candidatus Riflebacteria bacterium]
MSKQTRRHRSMAWGIVGLVLMGGLSVLFPMQALSVALPEDAPAALRFLQDLESGKISLSDLLDSLEEFIGLRLPTSSTFHTRSSAVDPLRNPVPVRVATLPALCDEAIYDYRQTLKTEFIKVAGAVDGRLSQTQFSSLVAEGKFPSVTDPGAYFTTHDQDRDGFLSIHEFTPTPAEVPRLQNIPELTDAYVKGQPYPTGQLPTGVPPSLPPPPIFLTVEQVEARIQAFADSRGFTTERAPDGKLVVRDQAGNLVPLPPGTIPLPIEEAERGLADFARSIGGTTERGAGGALVVKGPDGKEIPPPGWPPPLRPPYLPPLTGP